MNFRTKHRFKDSKTKERFFTKKSRSNMKNIKTKHEKHQNSLQSNQLTSVNCLNQTLSAITK